MVTRHRVGAVAMLLLFQTERAINPPASPLRARAYGWSHTIPGSPLTFSVLQASICHPHSTTEEPEAQGGQVNCPGHTAGITEVCWASGS